jgi:hypothetical protein
MLYSPPAAQAASPLSVEVRIIPSLSATVIALLHLLSVLLSVYSLIELPARSIG